MSKIMDIIDNQTWFMIDIDGVCINTIERLVYNLPYLKSHTMSWHEHIFNSTQINGSLDILREIQYKIKHINLLTKNTTMEEEIAKIDFFKYNRIYIPIISVPFFLNKTDVVHPSNYNGNVILVDDSLKNIKTWNKEGGKGIWFINQKIKYTDTEQDLMKVKSLKFLREVK